MSRSPRVTSPGVRFAEWIAGIKGWIYQPFLLLMIGFSALAGLYASREFEDGSWGRADSLLVGSFVISVVVVAGLQAVRDAGQQVIHRDLDILILNAKAKMRTDFGDALDTSIEEIGELAAASPDRKGEIFGGVIRLLLSAACELTGPGEGRMRASFFEYREAQDGSPEGLYHYASVGRQGTSVYDFLAGTHIGDEAIRMVKEREYLLEPDVSSAPPIHWTKGKPAEYESFLSVASAIKRRPVGMITIDSTLAADIDEDDVPMATLIARIVGVACSLKG